MRGEESGEGENKGQSGEVGTMEGEEVDVRLGQRSLLTGCLFSARGFRHCISLLGLL